MLETIGLYPKVSGHTYKLYGHGFHCSKPMRLDSAPLSSISRSTEIVHEWPRHFRLPELQSWFDSYMVQDFRIMRWQGIGDFAIGEEGKKVYMNLDPRTPWSVVQAYLLTQVLSEILLQRGEEALHGVAVEVGGRALLFVGQSGMGKSSLLVHLLNSGARFISDDLLVLSYGSCGYLIHRGLPRIKLYDDSQLAAKFSSDTVESLSPYTEKKIYSVAASILSPLETIPVDQVFVLRRTRASAPRVRKLSGVQKFQGLAKNVFNSIDRSMGRSHLQLKSLAAWSGLNVSDLYIPQKLDLLPQVAEWIIGERN